MKKVLIGVVIGALGVFGYRKVYTTAYKRGIDDGGEIFMKILDVCAETKKNDAVKEEKEES